MMENGFIFSKSFYTNNACIQGLEEKRLAATGKQKINAHNECAQGQTDWAGWQQAERMAGMQAGVMNLALIPLFGNNSRFRIIPMQMPIFIQITWRLGFTFRSACLASYSLFIYLFTLYNPNGLYSNKSQPNNEQEKQGDFKCLKEVSPIHPWMSES